MERKWPGRRWEQTTHRQCDTADKKSVPLSKAHHGVGGSTAQVAYLRAAIQATKCDAREVRHRLRMPNQPVPFGACYHCATRCHAAESSPAELALCLRQQQT